MGQVHCDSCATRWDEDDPTGFRRPTPKSDGSEPEKRVSFFKEKPKPTGDVEATPDQSLLEESGMNMRRIDIIWQRWVKEEHPKVFNHLELAKDGGFSEVRRLYTSAPTSRWINAFVLVAFVAYNLYYVIKLDIDLIWFRKSAAEDIGLEHGISELEERFYISRNLIDWLFTDVFNLPEKNVPTPTQVIGTLELSWLGVYFLFFIFALVKIYFDGGFRRWFYTQYIFLTLLPTMSTYSAIKLLNKIHPTVFTAELFDKINDVMIGEVSKFKLIMSFLFWFLTVLISFIIGFDTFLLKLRVVSNYAEKDTENATFGHIMNYLMLPLVQFVFQTMGVVQLGPFVQRRLFVFIFGGEDGVLQQKEIEIMETWCALLAKRIWRENTTLQFFAVMLSFSDEDFQSLVLNEDQVKREKSIGESLDQMPRKPHKIKS